MQRTYIYIDGFNLYFRGLKDSPYKWLDLEKLCRTILDKTHDIKSIKYFTATVSGKTDPHKPKNQQTYINALKKFIPTFSEYYGHFLTKPAWAMLAEPTDEKKFVKILKTEEKGSDVSLAVHILNDAWLNKYDCAVIISNDSDLAESINLVKQHHQKTIGLLLPPHCNPSKKLMSIVDFVKTIRYQALSVSQLPNTIPGADPGTNIHKPTKWEIETELHRQKIPYVNLLITNVEQISDYLIKIHFSFRDRKKHFTGQASIDNNTLNIDKIKEDL